MSASADCIFCKIARGEIPSRKIWESDDALAFLDIAPLAPGHTLLIPKSHLVDIRDASPEQAASLFLQAPKIAEAVMRATKSEGVNILQNTGAAAGQAVFHLHVHFIPRIAGDGLGFRWNAGNYESENAADELASGIRSRIK